MAQWDNQNLVSQRSRVRLQTVLVFLLCLSRTYKRDIKTQDKNVTIFIVLSWALTVIYNMYNSMTSLGVHLYPLFVLSLIYIFEFSINKYYYYYYLTTYVLNIMNSL